MGKSIAIRTCLVAVGVAVLVLAGAAPAMAGKATKKQGAGRPASPGHSPSAAARTGSPPGHARTSAKSAPKSAKLAKPGGPATATPTRTKAGTERGTKGRRLARGRDQGQAPVKGGKPAPASTSRTDSERRTARVLGLRMGGGAPDAPESDAARLALFPRPAGEALPFTGGDIAAMLFIGMMMITIGGLIWRAPSLIDKPRRSRNLSV